jgi:hypothetical protein
MSTEGDEMSAEDETPPEPTHPIDPGGQPTHPIAPGGPPLGFWGGSAPWPGYATPPIYYPPLGIWGGPWYPPIISGGPIDPYPDHGLPGPQPPPGKPTHPIYWPPVISGGPIDPYPDIGGPGPQPPSGGVPTHPIVIPPDAPPETVDEEKSFYVVAYGQAPCVRLRSDSPEHASHSYGDLFRIPVGETITVFTAAEDFVVTTEPVEVNPL